MGDFVCRSPRTEPLMSLPPETDPAKLVCEAPETPPENICAAPETAVKASPPPVHKAAPKDHYQPPVSGGRSVSAHTFLDENEGVCRDPAFLPPEEQVCSSRQPVSETRFDASLEQSKVLAELDLEARDLDGAQNRSQGDIEGTIHRGSIAVNQALFAPALKALKGSHSKNEADHTETEIKDAYFDPQDKAYVLKLKVTKSWDIPYFFDPSVWDNFEVRFKANDQGKLVAQLDDNWMPDAKILSQLEGRIRDTLRQKIPAEYQALHFDMEQHDNRLELKPQVKNLELPLGEQGNLKIDQINNDQAKVHLDAQGNVHVDLNQVDFKGSTGTASRQTAVASPTPDQLKLHAKLAIGKDNSRQAFAKGQVRVELDESESPQIRLGNDNLANFMKSGTLESNFSLYLKQQPGAQPEVESQSEVSIRKADLGAGKKVDLHTSLKLKFDPDKGLELEPGDYDYAPLPIQTSDNAVSFYVNGHEYYPEMKRLIGNARSSVDLETYMFTDDQTGREIARLLARKAAGLKPEGPLEHSEISPDGVKVRFVFNSWKGNQADGQASEKMLRDAMAEVQQELKKTGWSPAQQARAMANMEANLKWKFFSEGILRSDHRKVLVVDGEQATVGGMNLGGHYLSDDAYHDVSIKMAGPEVRQVQREFLENWYEFNGLPQPTEAEWQRLLKSPDELRVKQEALEAEGQYRQQAGVQTLVTDDQQVDIERGLVKLIDSAQDQINIQQAFFADQTINRHLAAAIQRGVKINVVVAEDPLAASVFTAANLLSVHELAKLKQAGAPGDIHLYYYHHEDGGERNHIHTKALTVDGDQAIIGSANMVGRSLGSPFWQVDSSGQASQAMYNKEMSLLIQNQNFVEEINQRLFDADMVQRSRELDAKAIEDAVRQAGGEAKLRTQALAAPFT